MQRAVDGNRSARRNGGGARETAESAAAAASQTGVKRLASGSEAPAAHGGSGAEQSAGTASSNTNKARTQEFRRAVRELQRQYVGAKGDVDKQLAELIEEWNPLLDEQAKKNLVEDVNSLVRDFLRRMKIGFRLVPPDRSRIQNLADQLSRNSAFDQIRRKEALKRYLELYMLKVLGK
jgi:hypothetical protein